MVLSDSILIDVKTCVPSVPTFREFILPVQCAGSNTNRWDVEIKEFEQEAVGCGYTSQDYLCSPPFL